MRETSTDEFLGTFETSRANAAQGPKRERVLTFVDKLYRDSEISVDMWFAAGALRNMLLLEMPPSVGVSSYGLSVKASEPSAKADRAGKRHTGWKIQPDGEILRPGDPGNPGGRPSRSNERRLEDAIFAACGLHDTELKRRVNVKHAELLIRIVTYTETMPTLKAITQGLTDRYGPKSKQGPPYAFGIVETLLGRLALHFKSTGWA